MIRKLVEVLTIAAILVVLTLCLSGNQWLFSFDKGSNLIQPLLVACADSSTQWMIYLGALVYLLLFMLRHHSVTGTRPYFTNNPHVWLLGLLSIASAGYALTYAVSSQSTNALTFIFTVFLSSGIRLWATWPREGAGRERRVIIVIGLLVGMLAVASVWHREVIATYYYRNRVRWSGPWHNPNAYGILMGAGFIAALGLLLQCLRHKIQNRTIEKQSEERTGMRRLTVVVLIVAATVMAVGLFNSQSRGAWAATVLGLAYLVGQQIRDNRSARPIAGRSWYSYGLSVGLISIALATFCFWHFRNTEVVPLRRAFSVANMDDFSWRNRLAAWEGSLKMIAEKPWFGFGWNQSAPIHASYYRNSKIQDGSAIELNDFLMVGTTLGLPALLCLVAYIWLSLARSPARHPPLLKERYGTSGSIYLVCRAVAVLLLVGFWFDGGLFLLPLATAFWVSIELGASGHESEANAMKRFTWRHSTKRWLVKAVAGLGFFIGLIFFGSIIWAKSRDPFERIWFTLKNSRGESIKAVAVLPKPVCPMPTVVYIHDSSGGINNNGTALRQIAELGVATVTIEYSQTNRAAFDEEFTTLLNWLPKQQWTTGQPTAWLSLGLGAQQTLRFLLQHPERQPSLYVSIGGGWVDELEKFKIQNLKFKALLVHSENDEAFPISDAKRLAQFFQTNGIETELKIVPGQGHVFEHENTLLMRCLGENVKSRLTPQHPAPEFPITKDYPYLLCIFPAFLWLGYWLYLRKQLNPAGPAAGARPKLFEKTLRCAAAILVTVALAQTAWHFIPPSLDISDNTLAIARKSLIAPKRREDFDALAFRPYWRGQKLKTLLTHIELSNYCVYDLANWKLDTNIYQQFVSCPIIDSESEPDLNWRRPLWEFFYPRVRRETDMQSAAEIIVRSLRERVTIEPAHDWPTGVESIWRNQIATPQGFERIYVATLRSTGIPGRLDKQSKAEFWTGSEWKAAPRPIVETWLPTLKSLSN